MAAINPAVTLTPGVAFYAWLMPRLPLLSAAALALLLLLALVRFLRWRRRWRALQFTPRKIIPRAILALAGLCALALALQARGVAPEPRPRRMMLVIDSSGSMSASDVTPSRFTASMAEAGEIALRAGENEIGLVEMNSTPRLVLAPTPDREALRRALAEMAGEPPAGGSDLDKALALAGGFLVPDGGRIVIFTDGERDRSASPRLARLLHEAGIRLEITGVGTPAGAVLPGKPEPARLAESVLQALAHDNHGSYRRLGSRTQLPAAVIPALPMDARIPLFIALSCLLLAVAGGVPW